MYNDRRYSLTRFSVNRENRAVAVVSSFSALAELAATCPSAYGGKNTPAVLETAETMTVYILSAKNTPAVLELADVLAARTAGSKNTPAVLGSFGDSDLHDGGHVPDHGADSGTTGHPAGCGTAD